MLVRLSLVEQRLLIILEVLQDGLPAAEVARRHRISRQTLYKWLGRYRDGGLAALADRSHRPQSCPHQMPPEVEARVIALRRQFPEWGPARLAHQLQRDGIDPLPGQTSIYRALLRNDLITTRPRRRRREDYQPWERQRPMELWQLDVMGGVMLTGGVEAKLVTGIDDHSRLCVLATLVTRASGRAVCEAFAAAMRRHGVPEEVLTDNGKQFTGRFGPHPAEVLFEQVCRENGITHRKTKPRSPTTTGKIERFHRTVRTELLAKLPPFASLDAAQQAVDAWVAWYNTDRPHQALGMVPPAERFYLTDQPPAAPAAVVLPEPALPALAAKQAPATTLQARDGAVVYQRWADSCGNVGLAGKTYSAGRRLARQLVEVTSDGSLVRIFHHGQLVRAWPRRHDPIKELTAPRATTQSSSRRRAVAPAHAQGVSHQPESSCQQSTGV